MFVVTNDFCYSEYSMDEVTEKANYFDDRRRHKPRVNVSRLETAFSN